MTLPRLLLLVAAVAAAAAPVRARPAAAPSPSLEMLKGLEGRWSGTFVDGNRFEVEYEVIAGGSAVFVRQFPDTDHEMVTLYHQDGPDLVLTHYCAAGNQPTMRATRDSTPERLHFRFVRGTNMTRRDGHMGDVVLERTGPTTLREQWTYFEDGRAQEPMVFEMTRVGE